jgi:pimeloyl-ACP methyl ester carboxylesterase
VIALHGWLDNSASFDVLAPQLANTQCLAIDLAGHGLSDHKSGLADYPLWSEVAAIYAIADEMGWQRFALIGHSRGAMMALLTAGVFPERISHLLLLDSIAPPVVPSEQAPERFLESITEIQRRIRRPLSLYPSYDAALEARCKSQYAPVTKATAALLARRGLREIEGKFHWHADGKLWAPSNVALSEEMVEALAEKIAQLAVPSLLLLGERGLINITESDPAFVARCQHLRQLIDAELDTVDDGHFLHMEQGADAVVQKVNRFLWAHVNH